MPPLESDNEVRFDTVLRVSPRADTKIFDFVSIFVQRVIAEKGGFPVSHETADIRKGDDNITVVQLKDVTAEARDRVLQALQAEGYGVSETPQFNIIDGDRQEMVA